MLTPEYYIPAYFALLALATAMALRASAVIRKAGVLLPNRLATQEGDLENLQPIAVMHSRAVVGSVTMGRISSRTR